MNKAIFLFIFIGFYQLHAQKLELGKVSIKELQEKVCPTDTSAAAAILFTKAKTVYIYEKQGFYLNHIYEYRIKIYKKEGLKWANFKMPYRIGYESIRDDALNFSEAITYNLVNNEIAKTKLKNEGSFKRNVNKYWDEAGITMPNVNVGSVIEFRYIIKSDNMVKYPVFNFQYDIPVKYAEYKTEIPEFFVYNPIFSGFQEVDTQAKVELGYQNYDDKNNQGLHMSYRQVNSVHKLENVPALKQEQYLDNIENYRISVDYELEKTRFPEVPEKIFTQTWEDVARVIYKDKDFGQQLGKKDYFLSDLRLVLKNNDSTEASKAKAVFKFVQNKMNWDGTYGYLAEKGVEKAYHENSGNVAEINFILVSMLNYAGLNANPVLLSTIDHGIPVYPNRTVFNYVVAAADVDGKTVLFDATNKYTAPGILRLSTLNWVGRLIRGDQSSIEINLAPSTASKVSNNVMAVLDATGKVTAKVRRQHSDYLALQFREKYGNLNAQAYQDDLAVHFEVAAIEGYAVENKLTDFSKPIVETFNLASDNLVERANDQLLVDPMLFFSTAKNPFQEEKRTLPVYFGFPKHQKYNIFIDVPQGYKIESVPKAVTIATPENVMLFSYKVLAQENKLQILASLENNASVVSADFYEAMKEFYNKAIEKQNEKIILKKL
ncbi:DUF3857 domain-containing protein [Flavobacterium sp. CYK-4]|uniref:DUF3857 domain-containing protein n=1 Tax=Flavobacterium lotistagni TaxID=2709660 RepID=UPI00140A44AA|nr:DUF3857 domain-containing protein [Flavobacterium lotistagni]NHM08102.1 DUF3857 domain-containing protein [Flavobacterium lotistagni]